MSTFCATEELGWRFVATSCLHLPNINQHVPTFGTLHPYGWHGIYFVVFSDDCNLLLQVMFYDFAASFWFRLLICILLDVCTFTANERNFRFRLFGNETRTAIRTKLHNKASFLVITLSFLLLHMKGRKQNISMPLEFMQKDCAVWRFSRIDVARLKYRDNKYEWTR